MAQIPRVIFRNCYTYFQELLGEWNLRQFWNITSGIFAKYQVQIRLLFVYTTTRKRFVISNYRCLKLSWNTTALSHSNCRNFSCSSIIISTQIFSLFLLWTKIKFTNGEKTVVCRGMSWCISYTVKPAFLYIQSVSVVFFYSFPPCKYKKS